MSSQSVIALADPMRRGCPARPPSPQKFSGDSISDQTGDCTATNPHGPKARDSCRGRTGRRCLWNRYQVSRRALRLRVTLCGGDHVLGDGMETGSRTASRSDLERTGTAHEISSPQPTACPGYGKDSGSGVAAASVEESMLATRDPAPAPRSEE